MKFYFLSLTALLMLSSIAYARINLDNGNPFDTLKAAFDSAVPAKINDYPKITDFNTARSKLTCVASSDGDVLIGSNHLIFAIIGRYSYTIQGRPSYGPLFRRIPGKTVTSLTVTLSDSGKPQNNNDIYDLFKNQPEVLITESGDLQTKVVDDMYESVRTTTYRKKDSELFWHENISSKDHIDDLGGDIYGYCYPH